MENRMENLAGFVNGVANRKALNRWPYPICLVHLTTGIILLFFIAIELLSLFSVGAATPPRNLPRTEPLLATNDLAAELVAGVDRFLSKKLEETFALRTNRAQPNLGVAAWRGIQESNRMRFAHLIGVRDRRVAEPTLFLKAPSGEAEALAQTQTFDVLEVTWPVFEQTFGEGLLLSPRGRKPVANIVAIPDALQTPEQLCGLSPGIAVRSQYARRLAANGCRVVIPALVGRRLESRQFASGKGGVVLTGREFVYRPAFELGRHIIGYEVQEVLALIDWFKRTEPDLKVGLVGWGEGGLLTMYASALDQRIDIACVSGYFGDRRQIWREPIDRNVFGLLPDFADGELAKMIIPRGLIIEAAKSPEFIWRNKGGAPGELRTPTLREIKIEVDEAKRTAPREDFASNIELVISGESGEGAFGTDEALSGVLRGVSGKTATLAGSADVPTLLRRSDTPQGREARKIQRLHHHTEQILTQSRFVRDHFMRDLKTASLEALEESQRPYREHFYNEVIGRFDQPLLPPRVRSRKIYEAEKWTGYEVVMDVFPDVIAYGILLLPVGLREGDMRPVVVCQHGLEGRPQDTIVGNHPAYRDFSARLADEGFIIFAPQNLYIFEDRFRSLQRKANPLGKTLFSIITPQHQQILKWLKTLPWVDEQRIGFYGLSYGGKTAMRVPALLTDYCLSICSGDFNEWVWKNASTTSPYSYVWTGEYEIFEFDLGSTFNYAEMAALIAPRPFMVERGHFDGVAPDETVGYEFAKVRKFYEATLKLNSRCEIEWFNGPHTINGKGTFDFLHRHLKWQPRPSADK